jgi:hypothetical protein
VIEYSAAAILDAEETRDDCAQTADRRRENCNDSGEDRSENGDDYHWKCE